jgi:hypothetical protein
MTEGGTKKMNNLFDRLKPEYKALLQDQAELYPVAIASFMEEFRNEKFVIDLKYGTVVSLSNFCNLVNYDISTIDNLFNEK